MQIFYLYYRGLEYVCHIVAKQYNIYINIHHILHNLICYDNSYICIMRDKYHKYLLNLLAYWQLAKQVIKHIFQYYSVINPIFGVITCYTIMQQGAAELSSDYLWFIEYVDNKLRLRFQLESSLDWARFG